MRPPVAARRLGRRESIPDMRSTIKRAGVLLATLMMITSCGGNDQPAPPPKTTADAGLVAVRGHRHRDRGLRLRLSAGHDGVHPPQLHQRPCARGHQGPDGPIRPPAHLPNAAYHARPRRTPTRSTPRPGSTCPRSRGSSPSRTWATATSCCRCWTPGPTSSPRLAPATAAASRGRSRSPAPTGTAPCRPACWSTSRRRRWCGCWAASTARAPRRTTTRCTSCRTGSPPRRCRRSASPICRRSPRSPRRSTW